MVVVSDTTPLNYLIQLGQIEVLQRRFRRIIIPNAVLGEMLHPKAPMAVRDWAKSLPGWTEVRSPIRRISLTGLGIGERDALSLALELKADLTLMDDLAARYEATNLGLAVAGTIGLIAEAHRLGWIDFDETIRRLRGLNYRISDALIAQVRQNIR
jgi:predicted nucleic acid-binding protein